MEFNSRKEQIEKDFLRKLVRELKKAGCEVNGVGRALIAAELKSAAMVGACEERSRALELLRRKVEHDTAERLLINRSVLNVLGYE